MRCHERSLRYTMAWRKRVENETYRGIQSHKRNFMEQGPHTKQLLGPPLGSQAWVGKQGLALYTKCSSVLPVCFYPHLRTCLLILERGEGRGRERKRNIDVRGTPIACLSRAPWKGAEPMTFWCTWRHSNDWAALARPVLSNFFKTMCTFVTFTLYTSSCLT